MRRALVALAVLAMLGIPASAAAHVHGSGTVPFAFRLYSFENQSCVEQQSPPASPTCSSPTGNVVNPTPCVWTTDQWIEDQGTGSLDGGVSVPDGICLIADGRILHRIRVTGTSSSPNLQVVLSSDAGEHTTIPAVQVDGNTWSYSFCERGPTFSSYPTIPDSNGGFGVQVNYTLTVTNPTSHAVRSNFVDWQIDNGAC